ncbi:hypothetical protein vBAmePPT11V19_00061 [Alteromonas phage vB_AmeP_PT11-V19]|nr:hypothetical protein vBAmePPT11V19_00061 [Alteromonas phage vB_AmeP_PT11-V19]
MFGFELTLYTIAGAFLLLLSALTVVVPIILWIANFIGDMLWEFIDEGESEYQDKLKSLSAFTYEYPVPSVVKETTNTGKSGWGIEISCSINNVDRCMYISNHFDSVANGFYSYTLFKTKEEAEKALEENKEKAEKLIQKEFCKVLKLRDHMYWNVVTVPVGLGLIWLPVTTIVLGSAMLSLYSMRWARRGIKLGIKVKNSLDDHISDKTLHK